MTPNSESPAMDSSSSGPGTSKSSITVTHRTESSFFNTFLRHFLRTLRGLILSPSQKSPPPGSRQIPPHKAARKRCTVTERHLHETYLYDFTPKTSPPTKYTRRIVYFAGGSWQMPPGKQHWATCARLVTNIPGTTVTLVSHPLAPTTQAPDTLPKLLVLYGTLLSLASQTGERLVLAGDSSGGNIALTLAIQGLQHHPAWPAPAAVMALSPSTDLTRENPQITVVNRYEPILTMRGIRRSAAAWRGEWDARDPRVSPLFADLKCLAERGVAVHGVTAGYDILGPDGVRFRERLAEEGVRGEWLEWDKAMHVFVLLWYYGVKEGREGVEWVEEVLSRT